MALLEVSGAAQAGPYQSLNSVKFQAPSHNIGGINISSTPADRKTMTTQVPDSINSDLHARFIFSFSGPTSKPGLANITPESNGNMIQCFGHVQNHKFNNKNKMGFCKAKSEYLEELTSPTTVRLKLNSPGGGGNKYLDWTFNPPSQKNEIKSISAPSSVTTENTLSAQINLRYPAEGVQTIKWGVYPKGCFKFAGKGQPVEYDNSDLIGSVTYQRNEVRRTFDVVTQSCSATSGVIKAWYADPGQKANTNLEPDITKVVYLPRPRR